MDENNYFSVTGEVKKRRSSDGSVYGLDIAKAKGASIDFTVTAGCTATATITWSSNGSDASKNISDIALYEGGKTGTPVTNTDGTTVKELGGNTKPYPTVTFENLEGANHIAY